MAYQVAITLIHPLWSVVVTDWLRAGLAWPELLLAALVSWWFTRTRLPWARSWWMVSAALLAYAMGQNLWVVLSHFVYRNGVPVPSWGDLGFLMQYPAFLLALAFWPGVPEQHQARREDVPCGRGLCCAAQLSVLQSPP